MYSTTASDSFKVPMRQSTPKPQVGMLIREGLRNFDRQAVYQPQRFGECRQPIQTFARFDGDTTHDLAFGPRVKPSFADRKIAASAGRRPAGGHPGQAPSKKDEQESQTLPAGAWLHHVAPEFKAMQEVESKSAPTETTKNNSRQITFGLTNTHGDLKRINKVSIFQDEI